MVTFSAPPLSAAGLHRLPVIMGHSCPLVHVGIMVATWPIYVITLWKMTNFQMASMNRPVSFTAFSSFPFIKGQVVLCPTRLDHACGSALTSQGSTDLWGWSAEMGDLINTGTDSSPKQRAHVQNEEKYHFLEHIWKFSSASRLWRVVVNWCFGSDVSWMRLNTWAADQSDCSRRATQIYYLKYSIKEK